MATATKIQLVEFNKDEALNGASLAFSSNGQLSGTVNEANDMFFHLQIVQRVKNHKGNVVKRHSDLLGVQELKEFCNEAN